MGESGGRDLAAFSRWGTFPVRGMTPRTPAHALGGEMNRDAFLDTSAPEDHGRSEGDAPSPELTPARAFTVWLEHRTDEVARRWRSSVRQRQGSLDPVSDALLARFFDLTLLLLPGCMGPLKAQYEPLFRELSELYGSVGAMRGLAAGEIIEEMQQLRELLIRQLFVDPPRVRAPALFVREVLRLNRLVDRGVTYASVGHTDAMFFALFQGTGAPAQLNDELLDEVEDQLQTIRRTCDELRSLQSANEQR